MSLFSTFGWVGPVNAVLVQTKTGGSIKGALVHRDRSALVLRAAAVLGPGPNQEEIWTKATGDLVIPMENVDYYQQSLPLDLLD